MLYRSSLCMLVCVTAALPVGAFAQNPLNDALRGAVDGARQGVSDAVNRSVNEALGVPAQETQTNFDNTRGLVPQNRNAMPMSQLPSPAGYRVGPQMTEPMRRAGLQPGDIVFDAYGRPIQSVDALQRALNGSNQTIQIQRNGQMLTTNVSGQSAQSSSISSNNSQRRLGIRMKPSSQAVVVASVEPNSLAARIGLRPEDRIVAINGQEINDPNQVATRVNALNGQRIAFLIERSGQRQELSTHTSNSGNASVIQSSYSQDRGAEQDHATRIQQLEERVSQLADKVDQLQRQHEEIVQSQQLPSSDSETTGE